MKREAECWSKDLNKCGIVGSYSYRGFKISLGVFLFFCLIFHMGGEARTNEKWKKGYVIFKNSADTVNGYLKIKMSKFRRKEYGDIRKVCFRKNKDTRKGTLRIGTEFIRKDTLLYFGFEGKNYKYIDYLDRTMTSTGSALSHKLLGWVELNSLTGWVELIEVGEITLHKGFSVETGNSSFGMSPSFGGGNTMTGGSGAIIIPTYCLKKTDKPLVLIAAPSLRPFGKIPYMNYKVDDRNKEHFVNYISDNIELSEKAKNKTLLFGEIEEIVKEYNQTAKRKK